MDVSKRERILLGGMGAAVLGAAIFMFWPGGSAPSKEMTPERLAESKKAAEGQLQVLDMVKLQEREIRIVKNAQQPWPGDPFVPKPPDPEAKVDRDKFLYSGFIKLGNRNLAVINGREYQIGEPLDTGGFEVVEITPEAVVLKTIGRKDTVRIPYQDPSFFTGR